MQIDKQQIIDVLKQMGNQDQAAKADSELPEKVDTQKDAGLLSGLGIDVDALLSNIPGGLGEKLGGLKDKLGGFG
ncbi:hypothetical protein E4J89_02630 [Arthrobacter sp. CAU 1506]|uniref:hypothetical protein n=1 Tax=Arthrobacter sp. CAU 1506 TaxID=2560052 RepID=UPI0010AC1FBD|nr:hypothetical protein [Arthrobacter sp. CAU 1506]TJY72582.1 hypothetical protein E4J89_02630 [Arthrobacter sp. CAU 1506]